MTTRTEGWPSAHPASFSTALTLMLGACGHCEVNLLPFEELRLTFSVHWVQVSHLAARQTEVNHCASFHSFSKTFACLSESGSDRASSLLILHSCFFLFGRTLKAVLCRARIRPHIF